MGSDNVVGDGRRARRRGARGAGVVAAVGALIAGAVVASPSSGAESGSCGTHFVASWLAGPTDAVALLDASGGPVPLSVDDQTFRMVITPHLGGSEVRVHLTNRFGPTPVTFARVSVGVRTAAAGARDPQPVRFGGKTSITVPVGGDVVSDPVPLRFNAFTPLAVSVYVPGSAGPPTKHWNANATSYYAAARSGDLTTRADGREFGATTGSWLYVSGLDVAASGPVRAVVAFGDSITDGFVGSTPLSVPADRTVADTDDRYPDRLQNILDRAGIPISVVNAGIGSNRLLSSGEPLMLGPAGLERFDHDALDQAGVAGVLLQEGINDLGSAAPARRRSDDRRISAAHRASPCPRREDLAGHTAPRLERPHRRTGPRAEQRGDPAADQLVDPHPAPRRRRCRLRRRTPRPRRSRRLAGRRQQCRSSASRPPRLSGHGRRGRSIDVGRFDRRKRLPHKVGRIVTKPRRDRSNIGT